MQQGGQCKPLLICHVPTYPCPPQYKYNEKTAPRPTHTHTPTHPTDSAGRCGRAKAQPCWTRDSRAGGCLGDARRKMLSFQRRAVPDAAGHLGSPEQKHLTMGERWEKRESCCWRRWEAVMAGGEGLFSKNTSDVGSPQINMLMEAGWGEVGACFCSRGRVTEHQL